MKNEGSLDVEIGASIDSEFIAGLREMGLVRDDDVPKRGESASPRGSPSPKKPSPKTSPSPKQPSPKGSPSPKQLSPPARAAEPKPPRDGDIELSDPKPTAPKRSPQSSSAGKPHRPPRVRNIFELLSDDDEPEPATPHAVRAPIDPATSDMELRVAEYLDASIRQMVETFAKEVSAMLLQRDVVDGVVSEFIRDVRSCVRTEVAFECDSIAPRVISLAATDAVAFREAIATAERERPQNHTPSAPLTGAARLSISAHAEAVQESIGALSENLRDELSGLHQLRIQLSKRRTDAQIRTSAIARRLAELEANELLHRAELRRLRPRVHDDRNDGSPEADDLAHQLRDLCRYLKHEKGPDDAAVQLLARKSRELIDRRDEVKAIRMAHGRSQGHFCQVVESMSAALSESRLMRSTPAPMPRHATEKVDGTRTELSVAALRSKFDSIQEERDRSLETLSTFLDDVQRKQKVESGRSHRHHHHHRRD